MRFAASLPLLLLAGILAGGSASVVRAQSLEAPGGLVADAGGHFSYTAVFTYPPEGAKFESVFVEGVENVAYGWVADGFCIEFVAGGTVDSVRVQASLSDPGTPGRVVVTYGICSPDAHEVASTRILPHAVPIAPARWSTLKSDYRGR